MDPRRLVMTCAARTGKLPGSDLYVFKAQKVSLRSIVEASKSLCPDKEINMVLCYIMKEDKLACEFGFVGSSESNSVWPPPLSISIEILTNHTS